MITWGGMLIAFWFFPVRIVGLFMAARAARMRALEPAAWLARVQPALPRLIRRTKWVGSAFALAVLALSVHGMIIENRVVTWLR